MKKPTYINLKHLTQIKEEYENEIEQSIALISILTETPYEDVSQMDTAVIHNLFNEFADILKDIEPIFVPIFRFDGIEYGFVPPSKMKMGEWVLLENYIQKPQENLAEIMAIIYRPIKRTWLKDLKWKIQNKLSQAILKNTSPFNLYEVEKYDDFEAVGRAIDFEELPANVVNGALGFFLAYVMIYWEITQISLQPTLPELKTKIQTTLKPIQILYHTTTDGS